MKIVLWEKEQNWWGEKERSEYQSILQTLNAIKQRWNIEFEVIHDFDSKEVYREVFLKNRSILKRRTGKRVNELRTRRGKGSPIINGVLGVFSDSGELLYYIQSYDGRDHFLQNILSEGSSYVQRVVEDNLAKAAKDSPEERLVNEFLANRSQYGFTGEIHREYPLARPLKIDSTMDEDTKEFAKSFSYVSGKSIDMLHVAVDGSYDVIEAKIRLDWSAVGQAAGYRVLFCKLNSVPTEKVRAIVLCRQTDSFIGFVCDSLDVKVITLSAN